MSSITWEFVRQLEPSATPGNTTSFFDEMCQSLYLDDGYIRTQIAELEKGQWQGITREDEITVSESGYGQLDIEHHFNGSLYGSAQHNSDVVFLLYEYMIDVSNWLDEGLWQLQPDSPIKTGTIAVKNGDYRKFEDSAFTLFAPGNVFEFQFRAGDSDPYPLGRFSIETSPYADIATSFQFRGRNAIGFYLAGLTFDETTSYSGTRTAIIEAILQAAGVPATLYMVETSTAENVYEFEDEDTYFEGLTKFLEYINWYMDDQPDGTIVIGSESYLKTNVASTGIYAFVRDTDVFSRKVDRDMSGVYSRVCVRRRTDPVLRVFGDVPYFEGWDLRGNRTFYQDVPDTTTQGEMEAVRDQLIEGLQYMGIVETFSSPFRPWLQPGDVATITGAGARIVGIITDIAHRFGQRGFFTEFTVTSGGTISNPDNPVTVATRYRGKLGGANRKRRMLDFLLARDNTSKGEKGDPGPEGEQGIPGPQGDPGLPGSDGEDGVGVPTGGGAGDVLAKIDATDYNTEWVTLNQAPVGAIFEYAGASAPSGWLLCDGAAISRETYATLFALISTTYGTGDGSTTFNLPNKKGRVGVGLDAAQTEFDTLGETSGAKTHTLAETEIPAHDHDFLLPGAGSAASLAAATAGDGTPATASNAIAAVASAGGGQAHNNLQPYLVLNYIIKF